MDAPRDLRGAADSEQRSPFGVGLVKPVLQSVLVRFEREGVELSVTYGHGYGHGYGQPSPGTKKRTRRASRMARAGLQVALDGLDRGDALWGGYGTDTHESTDRVLVGDLLLLLLLLLLLDPSSLSEEHRPGAAYT